MKESGPQEDEIARRPDHRRALDGKEDSLQEAELPFGRRWEKVSSPHKDKELWKFAVLRLKGVMK